MSEPCDQFDGLWFRVGDRDRVEAALARDAAAAGFQAIDPSELSPYGRWLHGEEEPTVRRYAVAPCVEGWTAVFPSQPDWDHDFAPSIAKRLDCRVACLMLHDGDVFTLHLHEGELAVASHLSSPVHFDLAPRPAGELDVDLAALIPFCREGTTAKRLREALLPPGRIDIDGRRAFESMAGLLGIGPAALLTYATLVDEKGLGLREAFADFHHLAFRFDDEESADEADSGGQVLRFPGGRRDGGA